MQLTIFTPLNAEVVKAIENADLDNLKPIEALNLLAESEKANSVLNGNIGSTTGLCTVINPISANYCSSKCTSSLGFCL